MRLIDVTKLEDLIRRQMDMDWNKHASPASWSAAYEQILEELGETPTVDAVPVVFCDKCKYWDRDWKSNPPEGNQHFCPMIDLVTDADFFCKDGEREGGNE